MRHNVTVTCPNEECEADIPVGEVTPYDPGVSSGPPERCYPPEGGEVEGPDACPECKTALSEKFWEDAAEWILDEMIDRDEDDRAEAQIAAAESRMDDW